MAILDFFNAQQPFSNLSEQLQNRTLSFDTWESTDVDANGNGTYTFISSLNAAVTFHVENLETDADNVLIAGSVFMIEVQLDGSIFANTDFILSDFGTIDLTGFDLSVSDIVGEILWKPILAQDNEFIGSGAGGPNVTVFKANNSFFIDGAVQSDSWVFDNFAGGKIGEFNRVEGTGNLSAADDVFSGIAEAIYGDTASVNDFVTLDGGNDVFILSNDPSPELRDEVVNVYGDFTTANDVVAIYGGNDVIDAQSVTFASELVLLGDGATVRDNAIVYGGDDTIFGATGQRSAIWGDALYLNSEAATAYGGNDMIYGGDIGDNLNGDFGRVESIVFQGGNDTIYGGGGDDNITGDWANVEPSLAAENQGGDDVIYGGTGDDRISGQSGFDLIYGEAGADRIYGDAGNDTIFGGAGADTIFGGEGDDRLYGGIREIAVGISSGDRQSIVGGDGDDFVRMAESQSAAYGGAGNDRISYFNIDSDLEITVIAGMRFSDGVQVNTQKGTVLFGGVDVDNTFYDFERITGSETGNNRITTTDAAEQIITYDGDDRVFGGGGGDKIRLGAGDDIVRAGQTGSNSYFGGSGEDTLTYSSTSGAIRVDLRTNTASGGAAEGDIISAFENVSGTFGGDDVLIGNQNSNELKGFSGDDRLFGLNGEDYLDGRDGDDSLYGGRNNDFLVAGRGRDEMYGGTGVDTFHFNRGDDVVIVRDFQNNADIIELDRFAPDFIWREQAIQRGDDVWIDFGGGDKLIIKDIFIGQLGNDIELV